MSFPNPSQVALIIPVLNGGAIWERCADAINGSEFRPGNILVIDSGSTDGSKEYAERAGFSVLSIAKPSFDHGGTRQFAAESLGSYPYLVYLTQDAILSSTSSLTRLLSAFTDTRVGVAYGRQLPRPEARPIEAHARLFNYPNRSQTRSLADVQHMGIKAAFTSNSFAAYRTEALMNVGGFPSKLILGEDMVVAGRLLLSGWSVSYVADAAVYHSHGYTLAQEFKRYFDIGVMHSDQSWLLERFGKPEGEGMRYVRSEISYLLSRKSSLLAQSVARTAIKYLAYKAGRKYHLFPNALRRRMSMHKGHWE